MYPIKNLEDLYDKEGYRDEEFDKDDKGTWVVNSDMSMTDSNNELVSEGMLLKFNRNTKQLKDIILLTNLVTILINMI